MSCELAHTDSARCIANRVVKQRELDFPERARNGRYCVAGACRRHFLTVMAHAKGEENYTLERVDLPLAAGADFVLVYVDARGPGAVARYAFTHGLLQSHVRAGLVAQGAAFHDAFENYLNDTWWLARLDMDAFLYSPLDGSVFDFLASTTNEGNCPEQYLVPRFDMGDSGHASRPGDFMSNAYTRATTLPEIYQAILYAPAGQKHQVDERSPHTFGPKYRSCEGIWRFGPLLFCPRRAILPYIVRWPGHGVGRVTFVPSGQVCTWCRGGGGQSQIRH